MGQPARTDIPAATEPDHLDLVDNRFLPVRSETIASAIAGEPETFGPVAPHARSLGEALARVISLEVSALDRELTRTATSPVPYANAAGPKGRTQVAIPDGTSAQPPNTARIRDRRIRKVRHAGQRHAPQQTARAG